jgi:hypothetical protein
LLTPFEVYPIVQMSLANSRWELSSD